MPYNDFVRAVLGSSVPTSVGTPSATVPGLQAPVQFTAMPGTNVANPAAQQAVAQNQQQVMAQAQVNIAKAQAAGRAQKAEIAADQARHRGGGFFGPVTRMAAQIADYPDTLKAIASNIKDNPLSPMAYGMGVMGAFSPVAAVGGIPQDYAKMGIGSILYAAAKGNPMDMIQIVQLLPAPMQVSVLTAMKAFNLAVPDQIKHNIVLAHDNGYKYYGGSRGVWEYAQSSIDDLPDVARYPIRAIIEIGVDPLTYVGVGAAKEAASAAAAGGARALPNVAAMSPLERLAYKAETPLATRVMNQAFPHGTSTLQVADRATRALSLPFEAPFRAAGAVGRRLNEATGLGAALQNPVRTAERETVRPAKQAVANLDRYARENTFADTGGVEPKLGEPVPGSINLSETANLPEGFDGQMAIEPDGTKVITLTDKQTGDASTIEIRHEVRKRGKVKTKSSTVTNPDGSKTVTSTMTNEQGDEAVTITDIAPDGKKTKRKEKQFPPTSRAPQEIIRVNTPDNMDGVVVPTIDDAFNEVLQRRAVVNNVTGRPDPFAIPLAGNKNPYSDKPGQIDFRDLGNGAFELSSDGRGKGYALPSLDGTFHITNDKGEVIAEGLKDARDAYRQLSNEINNRPYKATQLGGREVGPAFGANPQGARPQDVVAANFADDPRAELFNENLANKLARPAHVVSEDEARVAGMDDVIRRDATPEEAKRLGLLGRTHDSPKRAMAYVKGIVSGQREYRKTFGEAGQAWPRAWKEDQASIIRSGGKDLLTNVNDREAAIQAILTDNDTDAATIIDYFKTKRRLNVPKTDLPDLLIDPSAELKGYKMSINYGKVLEDNRRALQAAENLPGSGLRSEVWGDPVAALPERTGPLPGATAVGDERNMIYTQPGQEFVRPDAGTPAAAPSIGDTPKVTLDSGRVVETEPITHILGEESTLAVPRQRPPEPGFTRLYRAEIDPEFRKEAPDWVKQGRTESGYEDAKDRWFAADIEEVQHYLRDQLPSDKSRVTYIDVPTADAEKYRVSNIVGDGKEGAVDPKRYSLRHESEYFVPPEVAAARKSTILPTKQPKVSLIQKLEDAGDDPVARQEASDEVVKSLLGKKIDELGEALSSGPDLGPAPVDPSSGLRFDAKASGYGTYHLKDENGVPNTTIKVQDDNTIVVTTLLPSDDPVIKNIVAKAGDGAKVEVHAGFPDMTGTPMGLEPPAPISATSDDHFGDMVYRGWRLSVFSDQQRDALNMMVSLPAEKKGGKATEVRLADAYMIMLARTKDRKEAYLAVTKMIREQVLPKTERKGPKSMTAQMWDSLIRKWESWITHQRDVLMFNWATGPVSALLDHMGDVARAASTGHVKAAAQMMDPRNFRSGFQEAKGVEDAMMNTEIGKELLAEGITEPSAVNLGHGREEVGREGEAGGTTTWERWFRSKGLGDKGARTVRRAATGVMLDGSGLIMQLRSGGDVSRRFVLFADAFRRTRQEYQDRLFAEAEQLAQGQKGFNVNMFEESLRDVFSPDDVRIKAMEAGLDTGQAEALGRRWRQLLTQREDIAQKRLNEVFFSYEGNRVDDVLRKVFLFHYWYTRASVAYTKTIVQNPYIYINYMRAMDAMNRDAEGKPSAIKGMIKLMSTPGGFSIFMDPFKLLSTAVTFRSAAYNDGEGGAFDAYLAQSGLFLNPALQAAMSMLGYTQNNNIDPFATFQMRRIFGAGINAANAEAGGGMLGAPFQQAMNDWVENVSGVAEGLLPGNKQQMGRDPKANDKVLVRTRIIELVEKKYGISAGTEFGSWSPAALQTLETAMDALDSGDDNPYADQAYKDWARGNLERTAATSLLPVGTSLRSDARDNQLKQTTRIPDPNDPTQSYLPVGSAGFDNERDVASASDESTNLAISDAQFDTMFPSNEAGRATISESGMTQGDVLSQPQNLEFAQYKTWKKGVGDYHAFREQMERVSPAYANYMQDLRESEPYASDPMALDNAGVSYAAYTILNGGKSQQFDRNPAATFDPSAMNPSTMGQASAQEGFAAPTTLEDLGSAIQGQLISYYQDQVEFDRIATRLFGHPVQMDLISPQAQRFVQSKMSQFGLQVPSLGSEAGAYQRWSRTQPNGTKTGIADYLDYLRRRYGGMPNAPVTPPPSQNSLYAS